MSVCVFLVCRSPTGSMIMGDELHKFGRCRFDRNEIVNPSSRQIYLTFPADSTFREEDVSNYFRYYLIQVLVFLLSSLRSWQLKGSLECGHSWICI